MRVSIRLQLILILIFSHGISTIWLRIITEITDRTVISCWLWYRPNIHDTLPDTSNVYNPCRNTPDVHNSVCYTPNGHDAILIVRLVTRTLLPMLCSMTCACASIYPGMEILSQSEEYGNLVIWSAKEVRIRFIFSRPNWTPPPQTLKL